METKNKLMITCKESTYLVSKKQQDKLSFAEKMQLQFHLMVCSYCRRFANQIALITKGIIRLRANIEQQNTSITLSSEQKDKMKEALKNQQK